MLEFKELSRKYSSTFASIAVRKNDGSSTQIPVYFDHITESENGDWLANIGKVEKEPSREESIKSDIKPIFEEIPVTSFEILPMPTKKVYDFRGQTLLYMRNPQRQWQKGINRHNSYIINLTSNLFGYLKLPASYIINNRLSGGNYEFSEIINLLRNEVAGNIQQAVRDIDEFSLLSRCIDDKYSLALFPIEEHGYVLSRYNYPLAFYTPNRARFKLIHKIYRQEIEDFCRRGNLQCFIEE